MTRQWICLAGLAAVLSTAPVAADNLLDVYWIAEKNATDLLRADAERQAARQRHRQSLAGLLPQIGATVNAGAARTQVGDLSSSGASAGYDVNLRQPIYRHQSYKQMDQTEAAVRQADALFDTARLNLIVRVAERYFAVLAAMDNLEFTRAEKEAIGKQLEQTKQRFEVGLIAITDVYEAQAAFDTATASEIDAENLVYNTREQLRELTGQFHEDLRPLGELNTVLPTPADVNHWITKALEDNPSIKAAQAAVDASRSNIAVQRAGHFPYLDVLGSHSYTNDAGINANNEDSTTSRVLLQLTVPLYSGGGVMASTREAELLYEQSRQSLEAQNRNVQRQVSAAFLNVNASVSRVKALAQALISNESALAASEAGLEVGTRTTVDVLVTRRSVYAAKRDHSRARYDYVLNHLRLLEAAGSLSMADIEQVNGTLK